MNARSARAHRRRCAGALAALALAAGAGGCGDSATSGAPSAGPAARPSTPQAVRVVARAEGRQRARFALLRTRPEGLPATVRQILRRPTAGMGWALAQRIPVALPGAYWLVPGRGQLCVVDRGSLGNPGVGTVCARTAQALVHGVASITVARPHPGAPRPARLIVGVAPDGAHEARVHTRGRVERAPVADAVFVVRDATLAPPDEIDVD